MKATTVHRTKRFMLIAMSVTALAACREGVESLYNGIKYNQDFAACVPTQPRDEPSCSGWGDTGPICITEPPVGTPEDFSYDFQTVDLEPNDPANTTNERLRYYVVESEDPVGTLVYYHGSARAACDRVFLKNYIDPNDRLNVIFAEYPAWSGKNDTSPNKVDLPNQGIISSNANALYRHIKSTYGDDWPTILYGVSLGSWVSTHVANSYHDDPALAPDMLLLGSTGESNADAVDLSIQRQWGLQNGHVFVEDDPPTPENNTWYAKDWAPQITDIPVLLVHGIDDQVITLDMGERQSDNFKSLRTPEQAADVEWKAVAVENNPAVYVNNKVHEAIVIRENSPLYQELNTFLDERLITKPTHWLPSVNHFIML